MENCGRLFGQIAAEAGVTANRAKLAVYLTGLSSQGRSIDYAAGALRKSPETIKLYAREFLIDFADYRPFAKKRDKGVDVEPKYLLAVVAA